MTVADYLEKVQEGLALFFTTTLDMLWIIVGAALVPIDGSTLNIAKKIGTTSGTTSAF